jgi:hypothetical protein
MKIRIAKYPDYCQTTIFLQGCRFDFSYLGAGSIYQNRILTLKK